MSRPYDDEGRKTWDNVFGKKEKEVKDYLYTTKRGRVWVVVCTCGGEVKANYQDMKRTCSVCGAEEKI